MDSIKEAFLSPKEGLAKYAERTLKSIAARSGAYAFTNDGVQTITQEPIDFLPLTNISERVSAVWNEDSAQKEHGPFSTTDILSMTAGYDNLRTIYETTMKGTGAGSGVVESGAGAGGGVGMGLTSGLALSIETVSQQNPTRAVPLLTSDARLCSDPPMYPEAVVMFMREMIPIIAGFKDEYDQKNHILEILDIGVGNGEILAASCAIPRCMYTGVDVRLPEEFIERTTTDSPIRNDSRGILDIFSLVDPQVARRCTLIHRMLTDEEFGMLEKHDIIFIHIDYYTANRINIREYLPFLTDTGLIIVYGNPFNSTIWKDLDALDSETGAGADGGLGFWGMIGIQNVQKSVTPFLVISKDGRRFEPGLSGTTVLSGKSYGNFMKSYAVTEDDSKDSKTTSEPRLEPVSYRKRSIPQLVGNFYKATILPPDGKIKDIDHIVKLEGEGGDEDLEKYLNLFPLPSGSEAEPSRAGRRDSKPKPKQKTMTLRIFSSQSGKPLEQVIVSRNNPSIRIHHTRHNDSATALEQYNDYKTKYGAEDIDTLIPDILRASIFKVIQSTIEKVSSGGGRGGTEKRAVPPAVIVYHRDNFTTSIITSFLASLKVKFGILFSFKSDSGVLGLDAIRHIPGGASFFYKIQDAFAHFDDNVAMIINLASDISPTEITTPNESEKGREYARAFDTGIERAEAQYGYDAPEASYDYYFSRDDYEYSPEEGGVQGQAGAQPPIEG